MSCGSLRVSLLSSCLSAETAQARVPDRMTDSRKHHFDEEFIVAQLIENDRSETEFGTWLFHDQCYCIDILTGGMIQHDAKNNEGKGQNLL
jgi:hypothetical protein